MSSCLSFKRETHKYFYRTVSMDMRQFHKSRLQIMIKCQSFFFKHEFALCFVCRFNNDAATTAITWSINNIQWQCGVCVSRGLRLYTISKRNNGTLYRQTVHSHIRHVRRVCVCVRKCFEHKWNNIHRLKAQISCKHRGNRALLNYLFSSLFACVHFSPFKHNTFFSVDVLYSTF